MTGTVKRQGMFWGICRQGLGVVLAVGIVLAWTILARSAPGPTYRLLHSFENDPDGAYPQSSLTLDGAGNFYGTSYEGGVGYGTVFKRDPQGHQTVLYSFQGGTDGEYPLHSGVILDSAGNFYGMTYAGGTSGYGTVFKVDSAGQETVLYSFKGAAGDGAYPYAGVIQDQDGALYGTTAFGGGASDGGIVFKLDTAGNETVLYEFTGKPDGAFPYGNLILDGSGNLYGTTYGGGTAGYGTVFQVNTSGQETVLYSFGGKPDGAGPYAGLIADNAGNFYGATYNGGSHGNGTVFQLDTSGQETVLHVFEGHRGKFIDGAWPFGGLVQDAAGNLYGTTNKGGKYAPVQQRVGTVFEFTP